MSLLVAVCVSILMPEIESTSSTADNPAAWIAVLLEHERHYGRDAWSYQELIEARAAVLDPYYSIRALPVWHQYLVQFYFQSYPVLLIGLLIIGSWLSWKQVINRSWGKALAISLFCFLAMWIVLLPVESEKQTIAVIKYQGTMLREGNGISYPVVIRDRTRINLAAGVEARMLAEQSNGWVQIQLADGTVGWVPTETVYLVQY